MVKNKNKILSTLLLGILPLISTPTFAGEVLDRVMSKGVLQVSNDAQWPPQSFINDNNEMDGFDVDVAKEVAKRLGVKIEFVNPEWSIITAGNWVGRWDLSIGSMTPTADRAKVLDFPAVYYYTPAAAAVHKDSASTKPSDLSGKKIGVATGTTYEFYVTKDLEIFQAPKFNFLIEPGELYSLENTHLLLEDLKLGDGVRIDGVVGNMPTMLAAIENGFPIRILTPPVFYEPLALAIDKGDKEFSKKLADIVANMHSDGTLTRLSKKWYGVDYSKVQ